MSLPVLKRRVGAATTAAVEAIVNRHVSSYFSALYSRPVSGPSFLGIDVSLRTTGFAVLDNKGTVLDVGAIRRSSDWDVLDCGSGISSKLAALATQFPCIKVICLEEFMKSFAVGKFHTKGLFSLAQLNGIVAFSCWKQFGVKPAVHMPNQIRNLFQIKKLPEGDTDGPRSASKGIKQGVMDVVNARYPGVAVVHGRTGNTRAHSYDQADALLAAMFVWSRHHSAAVLKTSECSMVVESLAASLKENGGNVDPSLLSQIASGFVNDSQAPSGIVSDCSLKPLDWAFEKVSTAVEEAVASAACTPPVSEQQNEIT